MSTGDLVFLGIVLLIITVLCLAANEMGGMGGSGGNWPQN